MKSIQSILTIILAIFLIGMIPNLVDAKTKTITILPDQLEPMTGEDNYARWPVSVSSTDTNSVIFVAPIKFPKKAKKIKELNYYHSGYGGNTMVYILRCKMSEPLQIVAFGDSSDNTSSILKCPIHFLIPIMI